jgi:selenium metabolism protein YedF
MKTLDMRGEPCPIPVVKAKEILTNEESVAVLVDNFVAVQNLEKMAKGTGCAFSYVDEGASVYKVSIVKGAAQAGGTSASVAATVAAPSAPAPAGAPTGGKKGPVVLVTADSMGRGAEELGRLLIKGFIFSLTQLNPPPEAVIFLNSGAHLTSGSANAIADLKTLESKGSVVCTCGTCANYYKLTESLAVGSIVDMMNIVNRLSAAASIITI